MYFHVVEDISTVGKSQVAPVLVKTVSMNQDRVQVTMEAMQSLECVSCIGIFCGMMLSVCLVMPQEVLQNNTMVASYMYDAECELWCEMILKVGETC